MLKNMLFVSLLFLTGYYSLAHNQQMVDRVHHFFNVGTVEQKGMPISNAFYSDAQDILVDVDTLDDAEKEIVLTRLPAVVDYEPTNFGPYKNLYDFSVFAEKDKQGGILFVGDSTISWGFSLDLFETMVGQKVHAFTFGLNVMDEALLLATERIVECYYSTPPTVMVSHSLGSMGKLERLSRDADQIVLDISRAKDCDAVHTLVSDNRKEILAPSSEGAPALNVQQDMVSGEHTSQLGAVNLKVADLLDFKKYRANIATHKPEMPKLSHVRLYKILEPNKFKEIDSSDWSFYRWRPEIRIPVRWNGIYDYWRPVSAEAEQVIKEEYERLYPKDIHRVMVRHQEWAKKDACFILPITISGESKLRRSFLPSGSSCRIDFTSILLAQKRQPRIKMQSNHHFAFTGGVIFAAIAGKHFAGESLPVWQKNI